MDNGEFLSSKHARSPVVKLMVTLLLELITDHSREVITYNGYLTTRMIMLFYNGFGEKKKFVLGQSGI